MKILSHTFLLLNTIFPLCFCKYEPFQNKHVDDINRIVKILTIYQKSLTCPNDANKTAELINAFNQFIEKFSCEALHCSKYTAVLREKTKNIVYRLDYGTRRSTVYGYEYMQINYGQVPNICKIYDISSTEITSIVGVTKYINVAAMEYDGVFIDMENMINVWCKKPLGKVQGDVCEYEAYKVELKQFISQTVDTVLSLHRDNHLIGNIDCKSILYNQNKDGFSYKLTYFPKVTQIPGSKEDDKKFLKSPFPYYTPEAFMHYCSAKTREEINAKLKKPFKSVYIGDYNASYRYYTRQDAFILCNMIFDIISKGGSIRMYAYDAFLADCLRIHQMIDELAVEEDLKVFLKKGLAFHDDERADIFELAETDYLKKNN